MLCALSHFLDRGTHNNQPKHDSDSTDTGTSTDPAAPSTTTPTTNNTNTRESKLIFPDGKDVRHRRKHLPVPHGPYTVGSVDLMSDLSDHGAFFRLFYPTTNTDIHAHYKQWPLWLPRKQYAWGFVLFLKRNKKIFGRLANWLGGDVYVPSLWQAPLLREDKEYPVVIVSHGIGGNRTCLSSYCMELASNGFVVAALEHRDGSASMTMCLEDELKSSIRDSDHYGSDYNLHNTKCDDIIKNSCNSDNDGDSVDSSSNANNNNNNNNDNENNNNKNAEKDDTNTKHKNEGDNDNSNNNSSNQSSSFVLRSLSGRKPRLRKCRSAAAELRAYFSDGGGEREKGNNNGAGGGSDKEKEEIPDFRSWDRKRNKNRSLRQHQLCSEEWRPFQHIRVWDDFETRNNQMYYRAKEISEVLDKLVAINGGTCINNALGLAFKTTQFKNRLDLSRVAVIGHSFGAAAALAALNTDQRFKTGIALDAWLHPVDESVYNTTNQTTMFLNMEQFQWERNVNQILRFIDAKPQTERPMITMLGGCHQSVTDFQFVVPHVVGRFIDVCWTLQPDLCMSTCVTTSLAFLYKQFGLPLEQKYVDHLSAKSPHLIMGTNVDLTIPDPGPTPP